MTRQRLQIFYYLLALHTFCLLIVMSQSVAAQATTFKETTVKENASKEAVTPIQLGMIYNSLPWTDHTTSPPTGIGIEITNTVFQTMDIPFEIKLLPASRLLAQLNNGSLQAASVADEGSAELSKILACSNDILKIPFGLYISSDSTLISSTNTSQAKIPWQQLHVGVLRLSYIEGYYLQKAANIESFPNSVQLFRSFKANRINAINSSPLIVKHWEKVLDLRLNPILHFNNLGVKLCFSRRHLGDRADRLANQFEKTFFNILDNTPEKFTEQAQHALHLYDARKSPRTVLEVD